MSTFIQIHTLTSHSAHCLNRDDLGQPKSLQFHGRNYGRISSQCQKRTIREFMKNEEMKGIIGIRTKKLPKIIREYLLENNVKKSVVISLIPTIISLGSKDGPSKKETDKYNALSKKDDPDEKETDEIEKFEQTPQLIHFQNSELEMIKTTVLEICQNGGKSSEIQKHLKSTLAGIVKKHCFTDSVDIAMFGRMTTSTLFQNCDASVAVAHAITVQPVPDQSDFFTAVDDLGETPGSGHMDDRAFSSGIFYRYANINFDLLLKNLNNDKEITCQAASGFIKAFLMALPTGSQNSFAAYQQPYAVLITAGSGCPTNLSNAFVRDDKKEKDKKEKNPLKKAACQLIDEYIDTQAFWGDIKPVSNAAFAYLYKDKDKDTKSFDSIEECNNINEIIRFVTEKTKEL